MSDSPLLLRSSTEWLDAVMVDFDHFLYDHAAAEKKASGMAMSMISHYPDKIELVTAMASLAIEELNHFREVLKLIHQRGLITQADRKDHYVIEFRQAMRKGTEEYFLDRLLIGSIIEARGAERFALIADALEAGELKKFYQAIAASERDHYRLFLELAGLYFDQAVITPRWQYLLELEAEIVSKLPVQAALH